MKNIHKRFMKLAEHIATWSKDTSTKCGAVIIDPDNRVISTGYNGFPINADDGIKSRYERPQKYLYTEHAERNAIYSAAKIGVSTNNCSMFIMWFPCADCARAIIQSGISTLVCFKPEPNYKWDEHFKVAEELLKECGVNIVYLNKEYEPTYK